MKAKGNLRRALFGVALAALVGACTHEVSEPEVPAVTTGKLTVSLALEGVAVPASGSAARTVYPDLNGLGYSLSFEATSGGAAHDPVTVTGGSATIDDLVVGTYRIRAAATAAGGDAEIAVGTKEGVVISAGETASADITLGPKTGGANGTFAYTITLNDGITGNLYVTTEDDAAVTNGTITLNTGANASSISLAPGFYKVRVQVIKGTKTGGFNETLHIYTALTSTLPARTYNEGDLAEAGEPQAVNVFNLTGFFPAPVREAAPVLSFDGDQYTGVILWKTGGADFTGNAFGASTAYTAVVTLTAKTGYTFQGVGANAFSHGTITGTSAANSGSVTFVFPATEAEAATSGNLTISIGFGYGTITVTGSNGTNTITQPEGNLVLQVAGYTDIAWYVDGSGTAVDNANPVTLSAADYGVGPHTVTFTGKKEGITYSQIVPFAVAAAQQGGGLDSVGAVATHLGNATGGGSGSDPVVLAVELDLSTDWTDLLSTISTADKFVALDLSACTMSGTEFDPGSGNVTKVVSLVLPDAATSIKAGTNTAGTFKNFTVITSIRGANILSIGDYAFKARGTLAEADFPKATTIGLQAFMSVSSLATVNLPAAQSFGNQVFAGTGVGALTIILGETPPATIGTNMFQAVTSSKTVTVKVPTASVGQYDMTWQDSFKSSNAKVTIIVEAQ